MSDVRYQPCPQASREKKTRGEQSPLGKVTTSNTPNDARPTTRKLLKEVRSSFTVVGVTRVMRVIRGDRHLFLSLRSLGSLRIDLSLPAGQQQPTTPADPSAPSRCAHPCMRACAAARGHEGNLPGARRTARTSSFELGLCVRSPAAVSHVPPPTASRSAGCQLQSGG